MAEKFLEISDGLSPEKMSLEELAIFFQSGPETGLRVVLKDARRAGEEIISKLQYAREMYSAIEKDLQNLDHDKAYDRAESAHRNIERFLLEETYSYRTGLLRPEEREKLNLLRLIKNSLSEKKKIFYQFLESIVQLENKVFYQTRNETYGGTVLTEREEIVYFRKFIVETMDDPLRQAIVILKQEGMYLPESKLIARLNIDPGEGEMARSMFRRKNEVPDSSSYFLTGTHCGVEKDITLRNYLRRDPYSSVLINTFHAPKEEDKRFIIRDMPLIGRIPFVWEGKEAPVLYKELIGVEKNKFGSLQYQLQQGIVVMRSKFMGNKLCFEVKTQNPKQVEARFFYGATADKEKIINYMLNGSEEVDKENNVKYPF